MIKVIVSDLSRVLLFPVDSLYLGSLNELSKELFSHDRNYDFWEHFKFNEELLEYYKSTKLPCYIFTTEDIQDHPTLSSHLHGEFQAILSAKQLGITKKQPSSYVLIAKKIGFSPHEILYIDDTQANVDAAAEAGFKTVLYESNEDSLGLLKALRL